MNKQFTEAQARRIEWETAATTFVLAYLRAHGSTDCLDEAFHAEFTAQFGGRPHQTTWGAQANPKAMRLLKHLADQGILRRARVKLPEGNWEPGFPHATYGYYLPH